MSVKSTIKKLLIANVDKKYKKDVESKKMDYTKWILGIEEPLMHQNLEFQSRINSQTIDIESLNSDRNINNNDGELAENDELCKLIKIYETPQKADIEVQYLVVDVKNASKASKIIEKGLYNKTFVILKLVDGKLSKFAIENFYLRFKNNKSLIMIYSDEDVIDEDGKRSNPWFKPDWAPDDFLSYFYFGSMIAIRADKLLEFPSFNTEDVYRTIYKILLLNGAFDKHKGINNNLECPIEHIPLVLYHTFNVEGYKVIKYMKLTDQVMEKKINTLVSVVIPSKDHPQILFKCIDSFIDRTVSDYLTYEFIIVDNGSNDKNKSIIVSLIEDYNNTNKDINISYIYEEREFNFSYMCNLGAKNAVGDYILFLNDDMEIIESDWLDKLFEKANLPYAGAVGAKLLYPPSIKEGKIIQHAGITNLRIGPAHKLQFESDDIDHYYGKNRYCHDVIGVTGACLLVRKSVFDETGGFDEELRVAFNDVDLCFKIYEKGYYNIVRNDVVLYHHESLSRGNDADSKEKMARLTSEKDKLYEKHQKLYGKDPFYNVNLTTDMLETLYAPKYHYEVKLNDRWSNISDITDVINASREDKCVKVGMECAMDIYKWKYGVSIEKGEVEPLSSDLGFYFQGYTFVIGSNNACFDRKLLLKNVNTGQILGVDVDIEYRPDIKNNLSDQVNVDLTGFTAKIPKEALLEGTYQFGMYMKDKTSSLRIHNYSNWTISTDGKVSE